MAAANFSSFFQRLRRDQQGAAFVEFAFLTSFLIVAFLGMLEITMFVSARERLNKIADQISDTLGTMPVYSSNEQSDEYRNAYRAVDEIAFPHGAYLSFRFCHGSTGYQSPDFGSAGTARAGRCGKMQGTGATGSGGRKVALCSDALAGGDNGGSQQLQTKYPNMQFVVVETSCDYVPTINLFGYFLRGRIISQAVAPMRRIMTWN